MATLVRWEPFRELTQLQGEMGRLLSGLYDNRANQAWVPSLDVWETETEVVYAFDLPGLEEDRISIEVQDDTFTVSGERERATPEQGDHFFRFERRYGAFSRRRAAAGSRRVEDRRVVHQRRARGSRAEARGGKAASDPARRVPRRRRSGKQQLAPISLGAARKRAALSFIAPRLRNRVRPAPTKVEVRPERVVSVAADRRGRLQVHARGHTFCVFDVVTLDRSAFLRNALAAIAGVVVGIAPTAPGAVVECGRCCCSPSDPDDAAASRAACVFLPPRRELPLRWP